MNIGYNLSQALERASNGLKEKMLHSIQLLRKAERIAISYDNENGYYLAFSGGKDSQALYHITQLAPTKLLPEVHLDGRRNRTDTVQEEHHSESASISTRTNYGVWNEAGFLKAPLLTA